MAAETSVNPLIYRAAGMVRESRRQLVDPSPANVNRCAEMFAVAVSCMENVTATSRGNSSDADHAALCTMRQDLAAVASLLGKAAAFHQHLMQSMQSPSTALTHTHFQAEA